MIQIRFANMYFACQAVNVTCVYFKLFVMENNVSLMINFKRQFDYDNKTCHVDIDKRTVIHGISKSYMH